ncbi:MAG: Asp23/Gls24 family envelope stress response protein [Clostridia bacterium]|nr:Asp23/Gls24 family envelope stress response protein [Clostridia bacterium]
MQINKDSIKKCGGVVISSEVISSIAANAAKDIEGVAGLSTAPVQIKGMLNKVSGKPSSVVVTNKNSDLVITVYISVMKGYNIQTVSCEVQSAVKNAVQNMTGKVVNKVNVSVSDLFIAEEPVKE